MIDQFNATTGQLQETFAPSGSDPPGLAKIAVSPDRRTLYVARAYGVGELSSWDISTASPTLIQQISGGHSSIAPSRDGQFLYYVSNGTDGSTAFQAHLPTLSPATSFTSGRYLGGTFEGLNGVIYQSINPPDTSVYTPSGSYSVYDPATLQQTSEIPLGNLELFYPYTPLDIAFDNSGIYLFAIVIGLPFWYFLLLLST